jgi:hypothetical protein
MRKNCVKKGYLSLEYRYWLQFLLICLALYTLRMYVQWNGCTLSYRSIRFIKFPLTPSYKSKGIIYYENYIWLFRQKRRVVGPSQYATFCFGNVWLLSITANITRTFTFVKILKNNVVFCFEYRTSPENAVVPKYHCGVWIVRVFSKCNLKMMQ